MAKGEFANYEQLLLLSQCFKMSSAADASKCFYMLGRVKDNASFLIMSKLNSQHKKSQMSSGKG